MNNEYAEQLTLCRRVALLEAHRRGVDQTEADDVAQEACIALLLALRAGKTIKSVGGWSRVAAARFILKTHRDGQRLKRGGGLIESLNELEDAGLSI